MRDANSLREEILNRSGNTYVLQRIFSGLAAPAVLMHYPLFAFGEFAAVAVVLLLPGAALAFIFIRGVYGLVEGTADHRVRADVRSGTLAARALVGLIPVTVLVVVLGPKLKAPALWVVFLVAGLGVLIVYFRQCKKYWTHVQSVA